MMRVAFFFCIGFVVVVGDVDRVQGQRKKQSIVYGAFQQRSVIDKKGFRWEVDANGGLTSNSQAFSSSHYLTINGSGISPQRYQMTPDATRFLITGKVGQFPFSRQVKLDLQKGTVRYLDTITNPLAQTQSVKVQISLRGRTSSQGVKSASRYVTSSQAFNGVLPEGEIGFASIVNSSSYKSPLFYLCSARSAIRPVIVNTSTSNYRFQIHYQVQIAAGKSVTILHGAAQSTWKTQPSDKQFTDAMKVFTSKDFTRDIPIEIRRRIVNAKPSLPATEFGPLLGPLEFLAEVYEVERSEKDQLVVGEESIVKGKLLGSEIKVETRLGGTSISVDQVAAIQGGAGVGRQNQLLLRSGEVLAGDLDLSALKFQADSGLTFSLKAEQIIALFTAKSASDGKRPAEVTTWVATQFGDRIALRPHAGSIIQGVSTWGPVRIPVAEVLSLDRNKSEDLPIHRLELIDGSQVWVILQGDSVKVGTDTLGSLSIPVAAIDRLANVFPPDPEDEEESSAKPPTKVQPGNPPTTQPGSSPDTQPSTPLAPTLGPQRVNPFPTSGPRSARGTTNPSPPRSTPFAPAAGPPVTFVAAKSPSSQQVPLSVPSQPPPSSVPDSSAQGDAPPIAVPRPQVKAGSESGPAPAKGNGSTPKKQKKQSPKYPTWYLAGENRVVATLNTESFELVTSAGNVTVKVAEVKSISKEEEAQGRITFAFEMNDSSRVLGRFKQTLLNMTFHGEQWTVPTRHLEQFKWSRPGEDEDDEEESAKT
jgi:hypothetical protein